ncbi:sugar phosphate isomerase/epimerase family protein [uncultured Roseibium sp.]|uniref:sugar phosphate isomerase/epimerase family protein n=1 Tax=uncultured Roseibium sp. TaxID=1936171 RepID=UPI002623C038|nr:sugar phosphate isomerase/epimerase family protein [uncultured Roseibium sp.]
MPRLGLHGLAFTPLWNPGEADRLLPPITAHGVTVIETPLLDPKNYDSLGTRRAAERNGVEIVCSLGLPADIDIVRSPGDAVDYLGFALQVARDAGAGTLSGVTYGTIGKTSGAPVTERESDAICRLVDRVAQKARDLNMRLGLEPCNRYETHLLNTARQTAEIIERVGAQNVFIHLDTYHMNIEEAGMADGFADAAEHLGYVHLSESNRGVPGRGTLDWAATFKGLADVGFEGTMTVESFVYLAPEIASGLAVWRPVADRPQDVIEVGLPFLVEQAEAAGLRLS